MCLYMSLSTVFHESFFNQSFFTQNTVGVSFKDVVWLYVFLSTTYWESINVWNSVHINISKDLTRIFLVSCLYSFSVLILSQKKHELQKLVSPNTFLYCCLWYHQRTFQVQILYTDKKMRMLIYWRDFWNAYLYISLNTSAKRWTKSDCYFRWGGVRYMHKTLHEFSHDRAMKKCEAFLSVSITAVVSFINFYCIHEINFIH